ncbi:MAG: dipeptidase [Balneolales bacterium]
MQQVLDYIESHKSEFEQELFNLLRIPSVSTDKELKSKIYNAAGFLLRQLTDIGMDDATLHETGGNPIITATHCHAGEDQPTVLIYGHYDVQPPDPLHLWDTPPFEPTVRNGAVYARGASDDKGQAFTHIKSIEAYLKSGIRLPVNVKFILEGEEEIGSENLLPFIKAHKGLLACDMVLISDTAMFDEDVPSITYGLRGLAYMELEVTGPNRDLHSGAYGGGVQNPVNALCEILAGIKDDNGVIQIPHFYDKVKNLTEEERKAYKKLPFDEGLYKKTLGIDEMFGEKGYGTLERVSARPTFDINGIWGGYTGEGAKTVLPSKAYAKVSMRLVPDQDPKEIAKLFQEYVESIAPKGVKVNVREHHGGHPASVDFKFYGFKAAAKAFKQVYNKDPLYTREGGSIPIVADFKKILGVDSILMGFGLNSNAIHSPNEHFALKDFHRGIKTSAFFLNYLKEFSKS